MFNLEAKTKEAQYRADEFDTALVRQAARRGLGKCEEATKIVRNAFALPGATFTLPLDSSVEITVRWHPAGYLVNLVNDRQTVARLGFDTKVDAIAYIDGHLRTARANRIANEQ